MRITEEQKRAFKEMGVRTVYLFGSRAQGIAGPLSDSDIGVVFDKPERYRNRTLEAYNRLYRLFSDAFRETPGEVDVVFLQFTPLALQYRAIRDGQVLYESSRQARFQYQYAVIKFHADMKHFINMRHRAILDRI